MKITKFEQSGFILETDAGFKLAIDIAVLTPIEKLEGVTADAMLVSHLHRDHLSAEHIKKINPKKIYLSQECIDTLGTDKPASEIVTVKAGDSIDIDGGIKVSFFEVDHGPNVTMKPKENFGMLIEIDGEKVYFAGDMFYPSGMDVKTLEADRVLVPVGTGYTFGPAEALAFIKQFKSIVAVTPMHYGPHPETRQQFIDLAVAADFAIDPTVINATI